MDTAKHTARLFPATRPALVLLATSLGVLVAQVDTSVVTLASNASAPTSARP